MSVRIVTDSTAGLPRNIIDELGITVVDLHVMEADAKGKTTSGVTALELAAEYGRQLERSSIDSNTGGDDGVLALHLSRELSSTWSAAVSASGVFPGTVRVIDSGTVGMNLGAAAMAAARLALDGADLNECYDAAKDTLERALTWVYLDHTDAIRKSGRMSSPSDMLSTALLATKPIMRVAGGKLELVGKTRTQTKAFTKLVEFIAERCDGQPVFVALQHCGAEADAVRLQKLLKGALPPGSSFMMVEMVDVLAVHAGTGAIGVSVVFSSLDES